MSRDSRAKWDRRYAGVVYRYGREPKPWLVENEGWIPQGGRALDLGSGEGQTSVWLCQRGFETLGIDFSGVAVAKAKHLAKDHRVGAKFVEADLTGYDLGEDRFDLITSFHYFDRNVFEAAKQALRPGGVLLVEVLSIANLEMGVEMNRRYLADRGELPRLFLDLEIRYYEELVVEEVAVARLRAVKPAS